jgi:hypothetical protein
VVAGVLALVAGSLGVAGSLVRATTGTLVGVPAAAVVTAGALPVAAAPQPVRIKARRTISALYIVVLCIVFVCPSLGRTAWRSGSTKKPPLGLAERRLPSI